MNDSKNEREKTMKTLTHGQQIKTTIDNHRPVITVGTIAGFAAAMKDDVGQATVQAIANGWSLAWTNKAPAVLESPYAGIELRRAKEADAYAAAVIVEDGEIVEIDGRQYKARYVRREVSDPVKFDLVA